MIATDSAALVTSPRAPSAGWALSASLPAVIRQAGERAAFFSVEFFAARIANANTRAAYCRAVGEFCRWCEQRALPLPALSSPIVAAYFEDLKQRFSAATVNLHLSAIRQWLDWLTQRGVLPFNPAASVKGQRLSREEGKTPVLSREQARRLFASFDSAADVVSLRDRAVLAVMLYGFVRVGAVVRMRVSDFQEDEADAWLLLHEKGGKFLPITSFASTSVPTSK